MAFRVLSQEEKYSLATSQTFIEKCKQAVRDFAAFWSVNDGSTATTEALKITWAKNRLLGVKVMQNPIVAEDPTTLAWFFLNAAKGKQYDLAASPVPVADLIAAWDVASSFEEFATPYFAIKGEEINFSASGN